MKKELLNGKVKTSNSEKHVLFQAIDTYNKDLYTLLAGDTQVMSGFNDKLEINDKTCLHYICQMPFDNPNEDKHFTELQSILLEPLR